MDPNPHNDPRTRDEQAVEELVANSARQLADCIDFLEVSLRARLDGTHVCEPGIPILKRLGPAMFNTTAFFIAMVTQMVTEVVDLHRTAGSTGADTIVEDVLDSARRNAAEQINMMETVWRRQVADRHGGTP